MAAVLRAGRQHLREHLGGVAVRQPLGDPHVVLVQAVAGGVRVGRPVRAAVGEDRQHVAAHGVGVERPGELGPGGRHGAVGPGHLADHGVHHLRRHEHRHRRALGLVPLEVGIERVGEQVAHELAQLAGVLDAVRPLPLGAGPVLGSDVAPSREAGPVGLDQRAVPVVIGLLDLRAHNWQDTQYVRNPWYWAAIFRVRVVMRERFCA